MEESEKVSPKSLKDVLLPLKEANFTEEFVKLWQRMFDSARDMDLFYEESREAAFKFKNLFDEIRQTQQLNDALRHVYYDALATKKKHEGDRDQYFLCDKQLADLKNNFVEESQQLALKNSKYVEYSHRFNSRREELFSHFLTDFARICDENQSLKQEKTRLAKESTENKFALREMRDELSELQSSYKTTNENCKLMEEKRDFYKKESEWTKRQNIKLKESNQRLEQALDSVKNEVETLKSQQAARETNEISLKKQNAQLNTRCQQLEELLKSSRDRIEQLNAQVQAGAEAWKEEKSNLMIDLNEATQKLETARENNHKTMLKNQQLRESLSSATHKIDKVTREKLQSVLKENRTQHNNTELASQHLRLINEVLELKSDFFRDQTQIRVGAKLNRKLKIDVRLLEEKVQMLRENSLKIDPLLDGAAEYRKHLLRKYGAAKKTEI